MKYFLILFVLFLGSCGDSADERVNPVVSPVHVSGPFDVVVYDGQVASFSISAEGTDLKYQWYVGGVAVVGATSAHFEIDGNAQTNGLRVYCVVSNQAGTLSLNKTVSLKVLPIPEIVRFGGMVRIPVEDGPYVRGSVSVKSTGAEHPVHEVELSNSFFMDTVPVSEKQYSNTMKKLCPITHYSFPWGVVASASLPATSVSWNDAILYCNALNRQEGLDSSCTYDVVVDLDGASLNLSDSLLSYNRFGVDTIVKVSIRDSVVIVLADTVEDRDEVTAVVRGEDTVYVGRILRTVFPAETISVVPNAGYSLVNVASRVSFVRDSLVYDTTYVPRVVHAETLQVDLVHAGESGVPKTVDAIQTVKKVVVDTVIVSERISLGGEGVLVNGYRLPTEAEWEFAARARSGSDFYWGNNSAEKYAWFLPNNSKSQAVHSSGQLLPNSFGLYDMSGNVWEWCSDYYGAYSSGVQNNPQGATTGFRRLQRGGSCADLLAYCRSSQRSSGDPQMRSPYLGFRTVRLAQ